MKLIDVDKLITAIKEEAVVIDINAKIKRVVVRGEEFLPVIRCKDCKHWDGYFCRNKSWGDGYANYSPPIKYEDGFCDWADRRET